MIDYESLSFVPHKTIRVRCKGISRLLPVSYDLEEEVKEMEIIKQGESPSKTTFHVMCLGCKTEFRFNRDEGTVFTEKQIGDSIAVKCPVCGVRVTTSIN